MLENSIFFFGCQKKYLWWALIQVHYFMHMLKNLLARYCNIVIRCLFISVWAWEKNSGSCDWWIYFDSWNILVRHTYYETFSQISFHFQMPISAHTSYLMSHLQMHYLFLILINFLNNTFAHVIKGTGSLEKEKFQDRYSFIYQLFFKWVRKTWKYICKVKHAHSN